MSKDGILATMRLLFFLLLLIVKNGISQNQALDFERELLWAQCDEGNSIANSKINEGGTLTLFSHGLLFPSKESHFIEEIQDSILLTNYNVFYNYFGCAVSNGYLCYNDSIRSYLHSKYGYDIIDSSYHLAKSLLPTIEEEKWIEPITQPEFPGGVDSLYAYLRANVSLNDTINYQPGKRYVQFTITKEGKTTDVKIVKSPDELLNRHLIDVIEQMPDWIPATGPNGEKCRIRYTIPVNVIMD